MLVNTCKSRLSGIYILAERERERERELFFSEGIIACMFDRLCYCSILFFVLYSSLLNFSVSWSKKATSLCLLVNRLPNGTLSNENHACSCSDIHVHMCMHVCMLCIIIIIIIIYYFLL